MNWYIIRCSSGREARAERDLSRLGYPDGWHPKEKIRIAEAVYQRLLSARNKLPKHMRGCKPERYRFKPYVSGYVFLPARKVRTHEINGDHGRLWMQVLCLNGAPYELSDEDMARMRSVPDQVKALIEELEHAARQEQQAAQLKMGDRVKIITGLFEGMTGIVVSLNAGHVHVDISARVGNVTLAPEYLKRVD